MATKAVAMTFYEIKGKSSKVKSILVDQRKVLFS